MKAYFFIRSHIAFILKEASLKPQDYVFPSLKCHSNIIAHAKVVNEILDFGQINFLVTNFVEKIFNMVHLTAATEVQY